MGLLGAGPFYFSIHFYLPMGDIGVFSCFSGGGRLAHTHAQHALLRSGSVRFGLGLGFGLGWGWERAVSFFPSFLLSRFLPLLPSLCFSFLVGLVASQVAVCGCACVRVCVYVSCCQIIMLGYVRYDIISTCVGISRLEDFFYAWTLT